MKHPSPATSTEGSRRARLASALDRVGLLDQLLGLRRRLRPDVLTVLTYHRVAPHRAEPDGLDPALFEVTAAGLAAQLEVVKAHGSAVTLDDVCASFGGRPLPPSPVLVTFDDGYRDNHDVALPVLRAAGVRATFFVPTAYPDAGRLFWWDRIMVVLRRCGRLRVELPYPEPVVLTPTEGAERAARVVIAAVKRTPGVDLDRLWDELERATGVALSAAEERALAERAVMGWSEVRALRAAGMDVQSHSHGHRVLGTLTPDEVREDLLCSRRILGEILGDDVRCLAYPVGYPVRGELRRAVADAGFELAFTSRTGLAWTSPPDPLNFPRLSMDAGAVGALYKLRLLVGERPRSHAAA